MFQHEVQIRVRYGDTDKMGYVYYGNYPYYYEMARAEAIRALGISYKQIEDSGILMPVTRLNIKYVQPAFYDDLLNVRVTIPEMPNRGILFLYEIFNTEKVKTNEGETSLVFLETKSNKLVRAPQILIEKLSLFFQRK
ncbi:MAG: acyl-CoA thioesterase [Chitinophagales bacterium]|nr:acyl-CoA thioesterase [Chitinophagales bacterium]MCO5280584.1 acyl-CoA thioesterase [Chitinophagales bacterium]OJV28383.1 MAG: thioesterase [Bacteroidetes bacterium 37-13]HRN94284.1 thioesterase family protein [Chitinophagales bacterium]HRP38623.1 thioesterase family protein [Chitinophagales bacterium]